MNQVKAASRSARSALLGAVAIGGMAGASGAVEVMVVCDWTGYVAVEAQGGNGPMQVPFLAGRFSLPSSSWPEAIAADASTIYVLGRSSYDFGLSKHVQPISKYDLRTGQSLGQIKVPLAGAFDTLSDLTVAGGSLYAAIGEDWTRKVSIHEVGVNGALTQRFAQTLASSAKVDTPMLATDNNTGRIVLSTTGKDTTGGGQHLLIRNSDWSVEGQAATWPSDFGFLRADSTMQADGKLMLRKDSSEEQLYSLPSFTPAGVVSGNQVPGASLPGGGSGPWLMRSDEFVVPYDASQPAIGSLVTSLKTGSFSPLLRRAPYEGSYDVRLKNWLLPDGVSVSEAGLSQFQWSTTAPDGVEITSGVAPHAPLSERALGSVAVRVDPAGLSRGIYTLDPSIVLDGTHTTADGSEVRQFNATGLGSLRFAVDPISDNIIGNGDFELREHGWAGGSTSSGGAPSNSSQSLWLTPSSSFPDDVKQVLELPTANTPMWLEFDYWLDDFPSTTQKANLLITLNGIALADLRGVQHTPDAIHFRTRLDDPALRGLHNAELRILATTASSNSAWMYLDNLSLVAVPEPGSAVALMIFAGGALLARRRHRHC